VHVGQVSGHISQESGHIWVMSGHFTNKQASVHNGQMSGRIDQTSDYRYQASGHTKVKWPCIFGNWARKIKVFTSHVAKEMAVVSRMMKRISSGQCQKSLEPTERDYMWWECKSMNENKPSKTNISACGRWSPQQLMKQYFREIITSHRRNYTRTTWRTQAGEWFH